MFFCEHFLSVLFRFPFPIYNLHKIQKKQQNKTIMIKNFEGDLFIM